MANVHVQMKKNPGVALWTGLVLIVMLIGALIFLLTDRNKRPDTVTPPAATTGVVQYFTQITLTHSETTQQPC
jgi:succinate dehydrogenase hydrophobic anchor subunit